MSKQGKLIVFEGPDGSGKSSLVQSLKQYFENQNETWELLAFPGNEVGTLGKHIYDLHHEPAKFDIQKIYPESLQLLHITAHIDCIENRILPLLRNGTNILLDRFWWSTWVYGMYSGVDCKALDKMIDLELLHWQNNSPEVVILVDREISLKNENSLNSWKKLRTLYKELFYREKYKYAVKIINNDGTLENTLEMTILQINKIIQKKKIYNQSDDLEIIQPSFTFINPKPLSNHLSHSPVAFPRIFPLVPTKVYDTYWYFAAERQNIFFKRLHEDPPPWTKDEILARYKFTNAYRASDRVSQYLIKEVIYKGSQLPKELFFRILLFKIFNRISTWELLKNEFGDIKFSDYSFEKYDEILTHTIKGGSAIFSAAYIMPSGGRESPFPMKHQVFLKLLENLITEKVPDRIASTVSMKGAFEILRSYPLLGDFLAYQYVTDLNYSVLTNFSESEFVIPGPGARDGIRKCFENYGGLNEIDIIRLMTEIQDEEFARLGIDFKSLWGRKLQFIDCQNLFCEVDKYARVAHPDIAGLHERKRIKQLHKPQSEGIEYWYPPKWGINNFVGREFTKEKQGEQ